MAARRSPKPEIEVQSLYHMLMLLDYLVNKKYKAGWCNGSTSDSESENTGSTPVPAVSCIVVGGRQLVCNTNFSGFDSHTILLYTYVEQLVVQLPVKEKVAGSIPAIGVAGL